MAVATPTSSNDLTDAKSFLGRQAELRSIAGARDASPFVLLLGPGGAGKTRLARRFMVESGGAGALFCDLSAARAKGDVAGALAGALGLTLGAGDSDAAAEQVSLALAARGPTLIVLDNLETIGDGVTSLRRWVGTGPRFLGTSRTKLDLPGEIDIEVGPLAKADALALFADRAHLVAPELVLDAATEKLVERLDGNPLAIELAAARAHVLAPEALLARFSLHLDLLRAGPKAHPERHRSLRAVVDGSWALSDTNDREALAALSVFRGGFDLAAGEAVIGAEAVDRVESLLASSLVYRSTSSASGSRFSLYESVRDYAFEKLSLDSARRLDIEQKHAAHYRGLAESMAAGFTNAEPKALAFLALELDNLVNAFRVDPRSALAFNTILSRAFPADLHVRALTEAQAVIADDDLAAQAEVELSLSRAVRRVGGAARALEHACRGEALAMEAARTDLIADAKYMRAVALYDVGKLTEAKACAEEAIDLSNLCGAHALASRSFDQLGWIVLEMGNAVLASQCAERAVAIAQAHGFRLLESFSENLLGAVHGRRGEHALAEAHLERGLAIVRALGSRTQETIMLGNLAKVLMLRGDLERARTLFEEALALSRVLGTRKSEIAHLSNLASVDADLGRLADARARAASVETAAREVQHMRHVLQATLLLGSVALEEGRLDEAALDFARAFKACDGLESPAGKASAIAGTAASLALGGELEQAELKIHEAESFVVGVAPPDASEVLQTRAVIDARRALVALLRAEREMDRGDHQAANAHVAEANALLEGTVDGARASVEVRLARRLALSKHPQRQASLTPSSSGSARFEIVTRAGIATGDDLPADFDLGFDAIERQAHIPGRPVIDLRKKPIAARLLEVLLAEPSALFEKGDLFRAVWHAELRNASQGPALYKAVDRLAKLLDPDPRKFLRWDESGRLAVIAKRPALLRERAPADAKD